MELKQIADALYQASKESTAIAPIRDLMSDMSIEHAYQIQQININRRIQEGAQLTGKKIGLTSFAVQEQLGVAEPDFGILLDDMEVLQGHTLSADALMQPKAEAELAFVMDRDLEESDLNIVSIMHAVRYVLPAIEVVGSRVKDWNIRIVDTVADNASASHYVLGHTPRLLTEIDIIQCEMTLEQNDEITSQGNGSACMGSPLNALLWLAKKMQEMGSPLRKGEIVLSGALGPMINIKKGDKLKADFGNIGSVELNIS